MIDSKRSISQAVVSKLSGTSQKVRQAQILLKANADTAAVAWTDAKIADAYSCCTKTVENIRQRFVELGFDETLTRKKSSTAGTKKLLDGNQEANVIAMRAGGFKDLAGILIRQASRVPYCKEPLSWSKQRKNDLDTRA